MGIIYSITSYFYPQNLPKISQTTIKYKANRLVHCARKRQTELKQRTVKLEGELLGQISQAVFMRSGEGEREWMRQIIFNSEQLLVYDEVIYSLSKIMNEAQTIEENPSKISNECLIAICSLIFVYERLGLAEYVNLNEFIPEPFPTIDIGKTSPILQKYLKKKEISEYEINVYVREMMERTGISLQIVNAAGHHFVQVPVEVGESSPSAQLFAFSVELQAEEGQ